MPGRHGKRCSHTRAWPTVRGKGKQQCCGLDVKPSAMPRLPPFLSPRVHLNAHRDPSFLCHSVLSSLSCARMLRHLTGLVARAQGAAPAPECLALSLTQLGVLAEASHYRFPAVLSWRTFSAPAIQPAKDTLTIDPTAVHRLKKLATEAGSPLTLRIEVEGGGCSGFHYKFDLDSKVNPDDVVFEREGSRVVCDTASFEFLKGSKIEFEESLMKSAFVVSSNPNAEATCGCGTSFALKMK